MFKHVINPKALLIICLLRKKIDPDCSDRLLDMPWNLYKKPIRYYKNNSDLYIVT